LYPERGTEPQTLLSTATFQEPSQALKCPNNEDVKDCFYATTFEWRLGDSLNMPAAIRNDQAARVVEMINMQEYLRRALYSAVTPTRPWI
jgi:hypothetical protein